MDITLKIGHPQRNGAGAGGKSAGHPDAQRGVGGADRRGGGPAGAERAHRYARLRDIVHPGEKIAIITSDITRPMPTWKVMPALLDELYDAGVKREDITLVFALGQSPLPYGGGAAPSGRRPCVE